MRTLQFNKVHKNGWISFKLVGVPGAVFVDKRMLSAETVENPPATIEIDVPGMVEPGADVTAAAAAKAAKIAEREAAKAKRVEEQAAKAAAKLAKLQETAAKAAALVAAAQAKVAAAQAVTSTTDEAPAEVSE